MPIYSQFNLSVSDRSAFPPYCRRYVLDAPGSGFAMSIDRQRDAALALHRFGFGPRGDAIARMSSDPRGALMAELDRPNIARIDDPDLLGSGEAARAAFDFRQNRKVVRLAQRTGEQLAGAAQAG